MALSLFTVSDTISITPHLIVPIGTQVVLRSAISKQPAGAIAVIVDCPLESSDAYRVRFPDVSEADLTRTEFSILKQVKRGPLPSGPSTDTGVELDRYVIYRCIVGSQAYGLSREASDVDRRGIYLPPADLQWSLYGVPEQLESRQSEECYWELQKFLSLALKANPNILECLYTPLVEYTTEISQAILSKRHIFLSKLVFQTYNGYVMSQFKKLEQDLRSTGDIKWKHAMHLIRLLLQGISVLQQAHVPVGVEQHRSDLLAIRDGVRSWSEVNQWRLDLHRQFEAAFQATSLPEAPDYAEANRLLLWARRSMVDVTG
jgi:predicted nucleotidyltransferase